MQETQGHKGDHQGENTIGRPKPKPAVELVTTLRGFGGWIGRISWSPNAHLLAAPASDGTITIWEAPATRLCRILGYINGHQDAVIAVAFSPDGQLLASASLDGMVKLWSIPHRELVCELKGHKGGVCCISFDPTGQILGSGGIDTTVRLWSLTNQKEIRTITGHRGFITSIAFDATGKVLATASQDSKVMLWRLPEGTLINTLNGHDGWVTCVSFNPAGTVIASSGHDRTVRIWEPKEGKVLQVLEGHSDGVDCIAFGHGGRLLASKPRSGDSAVLIWRTEDWNAVARLGDLVTSLAWPHGICFHPSEPLLAIVTGEDGEPDDRAVRLFKLDYAELATKIANTTVTHTSAKVVFVGESNVGKSYLAHRLATGSPPREGSISSTHGMTFWQLPLERLSPGFVPEPSQRREVVLWDLGGQEEYRLVHQLFLHDTTVALILFDPTRGRAAFDEVESWNKSLERQVRGRQTAKLLVGTKLEVSPASVDRRTIERLVRQCGFVGYYETSALTGRGLSDLGEVVASTIDWQTLERTSRPELFQRIRDEIDMCRARGDVTLSAHDLHKSLGHHEPTDDQYKAVDVVTQQLAAQGKIARTRKWSAKWSGTASPSAKRHPPKGEEDSRGPLLVLRVEAIEQYAGSLILAARNNPRGVPALDIRSAVWLELPLPGIGIRLPYQDERAVLESTIQLMLEHGICFQHEGLLIFPTLLTEIPGASTEILPSAVSLFYDFSGAIDNIYASLVSWLVLAQNFGRVRLWPNKAEFEVGSDGLCGVRKINRQGGFAHLDVYFEPNTKTKLRQMFITFIEEHLRTQGVEIYEHVSLICTCGNSFDDEVLRLRIRRGEGDIICPVCESRLPLDRGAADLIKDDPTLIQQLWALKTEIEAKKLRSTQRAMQTIATTVSGSNADRPVRILHLSDLHFNGHSPLVPRLQWLLNDLTQEDALAVKQLDYIVVSGDLTDRGRLEGFEQAYQFVSELCSNLSVSAERCLIVPGNHDLHETKESYDWQPRVESADSEYVKQGDIFLAPNSEKYPQRFKAFSDLFYHKFFQKPYPLEYRFQGMSVPFGETGIQFLLLNSSWQIDQFNRRRGGIHPEALANALAMAREHEKSSRTVVASHERQWLRIAVWHHAVTGPHAMQDLQFLGHLQNAGVALGLHGDVHEMRRDLIRDSQSRKLHVIGAGSFAAPGEDRPESTPRLYNLLEIAPTLRQIRVHTRCQPKPDGPWTGWNEWRTRPRSKSARPFYDVRI